MASVPPWLFRIAASSARRVSTRAQMPAVIGRAAHVGDGLGGGFAPFRRRPAMLGVRPACRPALRRPRGRTAAWARPTASAMRAERKLPLSRTTSHAGAGHRDIHFVARNEAQVARAGMRARAAAGAATPAVRRVAARCGRARCRSLPPRSHARPRGPRCGRWRRARSAAGRNRRWARRCTGCRRSTPGPESACRR